MYLQPMKPRPVSAGQICEVCYMKKKACDGLPQDRGNAGPTKVLSQRPGIVIYFDMAEPLKRLDHSGKGRLFEAMMNYGQYGELPDFGGDGMLLMAWEFILPKLDADERSYRKKVIRNTYSSYCKKSKNGECVTMDFEEWCIKEGIDTAQWCRMVSTDIERYPNTTPKKDTSSTSKIDTDASQKAKAEADGGGKGEEELPQEKDFETLRRERMAKLNGWR